MEQKAPLAQMGGRARGLWVAESSSRNEVVDSAGIVLKLISYRPKHGKENDLDPDAQTITLRCDRLHDEPVAPCGKNQQYTIMLDRLMADSARSKQMPVPKCKMACCHKTEFRRISP